MDVTRQLTETLEAATAGFVDANEQLLDAVLVANRRAVDEAVRAADRLPRTSIPFAERFPTPAASGARYLEVVERAVDLERDVTARLVGALPTGFAPTAKATATKAAR